MKLAHFIRTLLLNGKVFVTGHIEAFEQKDTDEARDVLKNYYDEDLLEMPYKAPVFSEEAALWAAEYIYKAVQLTVLRDAGEEVIKDQLKAYPGQINPPAIYSGDLMLRYLPQLFQLAKGLAPHDILVRELRKTALQWPFSSVGIELGQMVIDDSLFENLSLRYAYIDRIIHEKDTQRIKNPLVVNYIHEVAGGHLSVFWPGFENL
jgi:hypothetical protein